MAEGKKGFVLYDDQVSSKRAWEELMDIEWKIHDTYGQSYVEPDEYNKQMNNLSILRNLKEICSHEREVILSVLNHGRKHYKELKEYLYNAPRREAQKFIGKKNVRHFIFNRDKCCLRCFDSNNLSLDHIVPINIGGLNRLYNLQTLCCSCNSWKGTQIIDYREGATRG